MCGKNGVASEKGGYRVKEEMGDRSIRALAYAGIG